MIVCVLGLLATYYYLLYTCYILATTYYFSGVARHLRWRLLVYQKGRGDRKGLNPNPDAAAHARARNRPRVAAQPVKTAKETRLQWHAPIGDSNAPPAGPASPRPMAHLLAPERSLGRSAAL